MKAATGRARTLSDHEAKEMLETLPAALEDDFHYLDEYLWSRLRNVGENDDRPIWSNIDEDELAAITRMLVKGGQHNAIAAGIARGVGDSRDYIVAAAIFGPRIKLTREVYQKTHKPTRKRGQREDSHQR